jgi:hypothetical protein
MDDAGGGTVLVRGEETCAPQVAVESTTCVMVQQEELVHGMVERMTRAMNLSIDAHEECLAGVSIGRLPVRLQSWYRPQTPRQRIVADRRNRWPRGSTTSTTHLRSARCQSRCTRG